MNDLKGMGYNAVGIEHSFAEFMNLRGGPRGGPHDADVFRCGDVKSLGVLIESFADHFQKRVSNIQQPSHPGNTLKLRIQSPIDSLRSLAVKMKQSSEREPDDYHWLIVSDLVRLIGVLLDEWQV